MWRVGLDDTEPTNQQERWDDAGDQIFAMLSYERHVDVAAQQVNDVVEWNLEFPMDISI